MKSPTLEVLSGGRKSWVEEFVDATRDLNSPELFRKWTAIFCIAAAMERRVHTRFGASRVFPNLFAILVAPPGVGKTQAIMQGSGLLRGTKVLRVAPDSISSATLLDALEGAYRTSPSPDNTIFEYHSLQVLADELGVLLPEYNEGTLSLLSALFDCRDSFSEEKRTARIKKNMINPVISVLCGAAPDFLKSALPEVAWGQGFMARMIMIYWPHPINYDIFDKFDSTDAGPGYTSSFIQYLRDICDLRGVFQWTKSAKECFSDWHSSGYSPVPSHPRLQHYCNRRMLHCMKLCMVASASRSMSLEISLEDFETARGWLLECEKNVAQIFSAGSGKGDRALLMDLQAYLLSLGGLDIPEKDMLLFLSGHVAAERMPRILDLGEMMKLFHWDKITKTVSVLEYKLIGE